MLHRYVDEDLDLCIYIGVDTITLEDVTKSALMGIHDPSWHEHQCVLIDDRKIEKNLPFSDYPKVYSILKNEKKRKYAKYATITHSGFRFIVSKLWQPFADMLGHNSRIFTNITDAAMWLGVDEDKLNTSLSKEYNKIQDS